MPRRIFSMLAGGWKLSASRKGQPSIFESCFPVVLLPELDTPITTTTMGTLAWAMAYGPAVFGST